MPTALSTRKAIRRTLVPCDISATSPEAEQTTETTAASGGARCPRATWLDAEVGKRGRRLRRRLAARRAQQLHDVDVVGQRTDAALQRRRELLTGVGQGRHTAQVDQVGQLRVRRLDDLVEVDVHVEQ